MTSTSTSASSLASLFAYVGIGLWAVVAVLTLIGALKGRSRGFFRQLVRIITVVASVFISFFVTNYAYSYVNTWAASQTSSGIVSTLASYGLVLGDFGEIVAMLDSDAVTHFLAIPVSLVLLPIVFVLSFMVISFLMGIVHKLICKIFGFAKWRNNGFTRFLGFLLGALQGFAVSVICLVPIVGLFSTLSTAVKDMEIADPSSQSTADVKEIYNEYIKPLAEDTSVVLLGQLGGNMLYEKITTIDINGTSRNMADEVAGPALKIYGALGGLTDMDWEVMTEKDKANLTALVDAAKESPYMAMLLADVLDAVGTAYKNGTMGTETDGLVNESITAILGVFIGIDETSLVPTLEVIRDIFFMLSEERVLSTLSADPALLSDIFAKKDDEGNNLIERLTEKLNSNSRTAPLVSTFTKISITVMAESFETIEGVEIDEETYENVKDGINDILSIDKNDYKDEKEYVGAISESLNTTFADNGIVLEQPIVDEMAQYVADNYSEVDELSDEEANDIILSYYSAYLETGEIPVP